MADQQNHQSAQQIITTSLLSGVGFAVGVFIVHQLTKRKARPNPCHRPSERKRRR